MQDTIRGFKSARWQDIQNGTFVVSTSGGGYTASFHVPEIFRQLGPDQFFILGQEFLEILDDAKTANPTHQDQDLFNDMMSDDRLTRITSTSLDLTVLRFPYATYR